MIHFESSWALSFFKKFIYLILMVFFFILKGLTHDAALGILKSIPEEFTFVVQEIDMEQWNALLTDLHDTYLRLEGYQTVGDSALSQIENGHTASQEPVALGPEAVVKVPISTATQEQPENLFDGKTTPITTMSKAETAPLPGTVSTADVIQSTPTNSKPSDLPQDARALTKDDDDHSKLILFTVQLHKETGQGLGFSIRGGSDKKQPVTVRRVQSGSLADRTGNILPGDVIFSVNGLALNDVTHEEALDLLRNICADVTLELGRLPPASTLDKEVNASNLSDHKDIKLVRPVAIKAPTSHSVEEHSEETHMLESNSEQEMGTTYVVHIDKGDKGLGVKLSGSVANGQTYITVAHIYNDGAVAKDGRISVGDRLIAVNTHQLSDCTPQAAVQFFARTSGIVTLTLWTAGSKGDLDDGNAKKIPKHIPIADNDSTDDSYATADEDFSAGKFQSDQYPTQTYEHVSEFSQQVDISDMLERETLPDDAETDTSAYSHLQEDFSQRQDNVSVENKRQASSPRDDESISTYREAGLEPSVDVQNSQILASSLHFMQHTSNEELQQPSQIRLLDADCETELPYSNLSGDFSKQKKQPAMHQSEDVQSNSVKNEPLPELPDEISTTFPTDNSTQLKASTYTVKDVFESMPLPTPDDKNSNLMEIKSDDDDESELDVDDLFSDDAVDHDNLLPDGSSTLISSVVGKHPPPMPMTSQQEEALSNHITAERKDEKSKSGMTSRHSETLINDFLSNVTQKSECDVYNEMRAKCKALLPSNVISDAMDHKYEAIATSLLSVLGSNVPTKEYQELKKESYSVRILTPLIIHDVSCLFLLVCQLKFGA